MHTSPMVRRAPGRILTTVLFTDIVGSTEFAGEMGDRQWRELLSRHHRLVRQELKRSGGREVETAGDSFFATFGEPASAIRCGLAVAKAVRELGIEIRAGIHTGEAEVVDGRPRGIAVHIAARVMAVAGPGEVLVSSTVRDLVTGANLTFEDRGFYTLKGLEGDWRLFSLTAVNGNRSRPPLDAEEAARRRAAIQPVPILRRRTGRLGVGAALVVLLAGVLWLVTRPSPLASVPPDAVGRIDPASGDITEAFETGSRPTAVAGGEGSIWVASEDAQTLTRLDPETGRAGPTVATQGSPTSVAVDEDGTVWVLNQFQATVVRINPLTATIEDSIGLESGTKDIAAGEGAVWVINEGRRELTRIDPHDPQTNIPAPVLGAENFEHAPGGVAAGGGFVWVVAGPRVLKVDPRTGEVAGEATTRFVGREIAFGEGYVWVTHTSDDRISKVDPRTLESVAISVGNAPVAVSAGEGAAWVANSEDGTISRVDPDSGDVLSVDVGNQPQDLTVSEGAVWAAVR
jgi:class 3 adenylate cyclase/streptogramin lyase